MNRDQANILILQFCGLLLIALAIILIGELA